MNDIRPIILVKDRDRGMYVALYNIYNGECKRKDAIWIAWYGDIDEIPIDTEAKDTSCRDFWNTYAGSPSCGRGTTLDAAILDLENNRRN